MEFRNATQESLFLTLWFFFCKDFIVPPINCIEKNAKRRRCCCWCGSNVCRSDSRKQQQQQHEMEVGGGQMRDERLFAGMTRFPLCSYDNLASFAGMTSGSCSRKCVLVFLISLIYWSVFLLYSSNIMEIMWIYTAQNTHKKIHSPNPYLRR